MSTSKEVIKSVVRAVSIATGVIGLIVALSMLGNTVLRNDHLEEVKKELQAVQEALDKLSP